MSDSNIQLPVTAVPQEGEFIPHQTGYSDYERGFVDGLRTGIRVGYDHASERFAAQLPGLIQNELAKLQDLDIRKALSDGLRHGSSECGKLLVERYRYGKILTITQGE